MAYQNKVTSWLFQNRESLIPQFTEFNWPSRYFSGLYDFEAAIELEGLKYMGRGIHESQAIALEKATCEAIERLICDKLKIGSVGVALSGETNAATHAKHEALERYFFNEHIRQNLPFEPVQDSSNPLYESTRRLSEDFQKQNRNTKLTFYRMATPAHLVATVCNISHDKNNPEFIGLALHTDPENSARHSFYEALANYARKCDSPGTFEAEVEKDQNLWACNAGTLKNIQHLFSNSKQIQPFPLPEVFTQKLDFSKIHELKGCPIEPTRAVLAIKELV